MRSINTEVPALGDSLSWDTNSRVCDITTSLFWETQLIVCDVTTLHQARGNGWPRTQKFDAWTYPYLELFVNRSFHRKWFKSAKRLSRRLKSKHFCQLFDFSAFKVDRTHLKLSACHVKSNFPSETMWSTRGTYSSLLRCRLDLEFRSRLFLAFDSFADRNRSCSRSTRRLDL